MLDMKTVSRIKPGPAHKMLNIQTPLFCLLKKRQHGGIWTCNFSAHVFT